MINGKTLQRLRTLKGLKQKEAAKKMGVSLSTYAKLEQSPWLEGAKLHAVLKALECSTNDLEKAMAILN
jgi:transcriptional regulator with XRE-family HTH domain